MVSARILLDSQLIAGVTASQKLDRDDEENKWTVKLMRYQSISLSRCAHRAISVCTSNRLQNTVHNSSHRWQA